MTTTNRLQSAERLLIMRDVLELGGTWTIQEIQERFGVGRKSAERYIGKLRDMYDLRATQVELANGGVVKVWRMEGVDG